MSVNLSSLPHYSSVDQFRTLKNAGESVVKFGAPILVTINGTYSNDPDPAMRALTGKSATAVAAVKDKQGQPKFVLFDDSRRGICQFLFAGLDVPSKDHITNVIKKD
jgi:hypothetical protein